MKALRRLGRRSLLLIVGGLLALGGIAYATIPDAAGVIHGCYSTSGSLRVIDTGQACSATEKALNWNQTSPTGPTGATGGTSATGDERPTEPTAPTAPEA